MIRARRAAIFDLDGTIIPLSSERAFVRHLVRKGIVGPRDLLRWFRAGARTGSSSLLSSLRRCKLYLAGKPVEEIRRLGEEFVRSRLVNRIAPGAFAAAAEHRRAGDRIVLLSGSLEVLVEPMAKAFWRRGLGGLPS
ncbi:MAG: hypothetical protein KatS3mg115_0591 [Candidatus Poribacteria bacterium]|nr:MAG: hypothetical protein KatS3mg115_0591 [Candidatus Poribacteria bacterium]